MVLKDFAGRPGIYKLHGGDDPLGALGWILPDVHPVADAGRMTATVTISTTSPDRSDDTVNPAGGLLDDHRRNPIVLFCHKQLLPIGMAEDRETGVYTVKQSGLDRIVGETNFDQKSRLAHQVFDGTYRKMFRGVSIGFKPVAGHVSKSAHGGRHYDRWKLIEYSHLVIPDNQDCLVEMVHKGLNNEPLCDPLKEYLIPLIPPRPATAVSGWEGEHTVRKAAMPDPNDTLTAGAGADPMDPTATPDQADPNAAAPPDHQATRDDAVGTLMATEYHRLCLGEIDYKEFMKNIGTIAKTHGKLRDAGGDPDEDDGEDEDMDEDDLADDEDIDLSDDEEEDYEDDEEKPGKQKHILTWNQKSVAIGVKAHVFIETKVVKAVEPQQDLLRVVHKALAAGKPVGPRTLGKKIASADRKSDAVIAEGLGIVDEMNEGFGPVKKAWRSGLLVTKAAPAVEDEIPANKLDQLVATFEGLEDAAVSQHERLSRTIG